MIPMVSLRFVLWLLLISTLMVTVLYVGKNLEIKTTDTAYAVATKRMLNKANYYKENWVIQKQPEMMKINGEDIVFSPEGWPLPIKSGIVDCRYWLLLLNENEKVFGYTIKDIKSHHTDDDYICSYSYNVQDAIILKLIDKTLSISIN